MTDIKTRFAPSPTGHLHVGGARTALFNYLLARGTGGRFLVRIEDTDRARHDESAVDKIVEDLRWLGLPWDEGIDVGGPAGPYRQSQRLEIYDQYVKRLIDEGRAYYAFETEAELQARREAAEAARQGFRYVRPDPLPTQADADAARAAGKPVVVRFLCPPEDVAIHDEAFGEVVVPAGELEDFIVRKADGFPTFYLANVVDDELMGVTHIMRGQEFLGQTWRQHLLRRALGFRDVAYCHLPLIMDMKGRKLSKRDGDVDVHSFRKAGYLPEALLNFIALLGWSPPSGDERMSLETMISEFSIERIGRVNAKFDRDKLLAFNTDAAAAASDDRLVGALRDYLQLNPQVPIPADDEALLRRLIQITRGFRTLADIPVKCGAMFVGDDEFDYDAQAVKKNLEKGDGAGYAVLADVRGRLEQLEQWSPESLQNLLEGYCAEKQVGLGKVAQPLRIAVTGGTISPQIFDTLDILGRQRTLARIDRCLSAAGA